MQHNLSLKNLGSSVEFLGFVLPHTSSVEISRQLELILSQRGTTTAMVKGHCSVMEY